MAISGLLALLVGACASEPGLPGISIPAGFADRLPIGRQIIGKPFGEETILKVACACEQATEWHKRKPSI